MNTTVNITTFQIVSDDEGDEGDEPECDRCGCLFEEDEMPHESLFGDAVCTSCYADMADRVYEDIKEREAGRE
jgi:protein-arginine kinase activator protein McsA